MQRRARLRERALPDGYGVLPEPGAGPLSGSVSMECDVKGETKELSFDISEDKRTLENASRRSVYKKIDA